MATWICLLRGVNLGARNKVNMPALREALTDAGLTDVRTYLQSGNVIADADYSRAEIGSVVGEVIKNRFALDVPVVVRTSEELRQVAAWCPFREAAQHQPTLVHIIHLAARPEPAAVAALVDQDWAPDEVAASGLEIAIRYEVSMHKSRLQHSSALRRLGVDGTARNWRTLQALIDLTSDDATD